MTAIQQPPADVREMYMAHTMFRREFALLPGLVRQVSPGDTARSRVVGEHIGLIRRVLHDHHHGEDVHLWPKLVERGPQEIAPVVHLMENQHGAIEEVIAEIDASVADWQDTAAAEARDRLAGAVDRMAPLLVEHLDTEEERVLPLIEKYVTAAEWDGMVQAEAAQTPPETGTLIFGMMMYEGEPAVLEKALSQLPEDVRASVRESAQRAFAEHAERVFGTATPPRSTA